MKPIHDTKDFFKLIFGELHGYLCIVTIDRTAGNDVKQYFYDYPDKLDDAIVCVDRHKTKRDVYFAPFLLTRKRRKKHDIAETPVAWADGDDCPLDSLLIQPTIVVRSSVTDNGEKYHFYWKFDQVQSPDVGESVSKRIAYHHAQEGMDKSGWDLTQILRVPGTYNHKFTPPQGIAAAVADPSALYNPGDFKPYPLIEDAEQFQEFNEADIPDEQPEVLLEKYKKTLNTRALDLFGDVPRNESDWSKALWNLELTLIEAGMKAEEAFVVARESACNKYRRDKRPDAFLWKEIQKAVLYVESRKEMPPDDLDENVHLILEPPELLTDEQRKAAQEDFTFVERYTNWARNLGDAAEQYHPAGAFVILSALLSSAVKLPTSVGIMIPNLWFMILADTTLTRKSTAMDNAMDMLLEIDRDALMATDGSMEGMLTALSTRPNRASVFLRDEVTGLIDSIANKNYMAGMMETLTKLYDGKQMKRILRRETVDVRDPILIMFTGGIRAKMMEILDQRHITSGFLPRFIFITAESDVTKIKPLGPPTTGSMKERDNLVIALNGMYKHYTEAAQPGRSDDGKKITLAKKWFAELTPEAWQMYNMMEARLLDYAMQSYDPSQMTPMMDRLAKSGLKCSVLIAASRELSDKLVVKELDVIHAFYYIEKWVKHTLYVISNIGFSHDERKLQKILAQIQINPGISRSKIMQANYLSARDAEAVFATLEQRNLIYRKNRGGRGERLFTIETAER